jgi:ABC-type nitrate/sulfonate/bicarbonate transport system permease component
MPARSIDLTKSVTTKPAKKTVLLSRRGRRVGAICGFLALWQIVAAYVLPQLRPQAATLLPPPSSVVKAFVDLLESGRIEADIAASLMRLVIGFAIAACVGVFAGAAMGWWPVVGRLLTPLVDFLRPIPPMAWIPIGLLWFGIGDEQNIFIIFLGALYPIVVNTYVGVRDVDRNLIWAAETLGGKRAQILWEIVLPASLPVILTGLRIGLGIGWMALVAAELTGASSGLAYLIEDSRNLLFTERVLLGMALIGLLGFIMDQLMRALQRKLTPEGAR